MTSRDHRLGWGLRFATAAWLVCVFAGLGWVWLYATTPGRAASAPAGWPVGSAVEHAPHGFTLLMFVHPQCACTRASLNELGWLVGRYADRLSAYVLLVEPEGAAPSWLQSATVSSARAMRGVRVIEDHGGREAERFGSATSGQVLLYDTRGQLRFRGGITGARGHEGDNLGRARVAQALAGESTAVVSVGDAVSSVFGCDLWSSQ